MEFWSKIYNPLTNQHVPLKSAMGKRILSKYIQRGGGECKLCKSPNTNRATCPLNKKSKNVLPVKHPKAVALKPKKIMIKRKNKGKTKTIIITNKSSVATDCASPNTEGYGTGTHTKPIQSKEESVLSSQPKKIKIKRKKTTKRVVPDTGRPIKPFLQKLKYLIHKHHINLEKDPASAFKGRVYGKAITVLSNYPRENIISKAHIETFLKENGFKNPARIIDKSNEYIDSGTVAAADRVLTVPALVSAINLTKIYGVGSKKAQTLFNDYGIHTIFQLKQQVVLHPTILNAKQKMGLLYYDDLQLRIPHKEIKAYNKALLKISKKISTDLVFSIAGSFRRGLTTSGDIDVLITSSNPSISPGLLRKQFIDVLKKRGIIKAVLANGSTKFMGITTLESKGFSTARHIDIIHTPLKEYPFALFYFTGSGGFNIAVRGRALKLGYTLNEKYIYDKQTKKPVSSSVILGKIGKDTFETERDIMAFLDMKYIRPKKRNTITVSKL